MSDLNLPPTKQALTEALNLSEEILRNIELSEIPLTNIALKASRLARLLTEFDIQNTMEYEASGFPSNPDGVPPDIWKLLIIAGRIYKSTKDGKEIEIADCESIQCLEEYIKIGQISLDAARDPNISVSSANPHQFVSAGVVNREERLRIRNNILENTRKLARSRTFIYTYAQRKHFELKYSGIADDIFTRMRNFVDSKIGTLLPNSVKKFASVYEGLNSENPENWANAVHSCRRILQDLADSIFPATTEVREKIINSKKIVINLGPDNYINRIIAWVEDQKKSERFEELVGSSLTYLGDRLDSIFLATQKGSHAHVSKDEADRYVIYTYLLVGDILSLQ